MKRMLSPTAVAMACACFLGACTLGPDYLRPELPAPAPQASAEQVESITTAAWEALAADPVMQKLVDEAIANNLDLRTATARVAEARAQYGIARSFLFPEVGGALDYSSEQGSQLTDPPDAASTRSYQNWSSGVVVSWDLDLFGRIRRSSEAAFAAYLATEEGRRAVIVALVADVASTYLLVRELDLQLGVSRQTLQTNEEAGVFYQKRLQGGLSNRLEVDSALANRARTAAVIPQLEQQLAEAESALCVLLGRPPGPIERGETLAAKQLPPSIPAGLPATLLEQRPDVLAAEQALVAANANIGAAKALFFPSISLTGVLGGASADFSDLLDSDAEVWQVNPSLFAPVFQGGRILRNYEAAQARYEQAFAQYSKSALNAYRETANALAAVENLAEVRITLEGGVAALQDAVTLSRSRYDAGLSNYLEVLNADQQLFDQELQLAQARGEEFRAVVELYRALGGGWKAETAASP
jgi:multidrug efflux system outer membrane protein